MQPNNGSIPAAQELNKGPARPKQDSNNQVFGRWTPPALHMMMNWEVEVYYAGKKKKGTLTALDKVCALGR